MKKVILKYLSIENFKGVKAFEGDFNYVTDIVGENGTGKTTIADSFFWLLFDKDSEDKTSFDIKPIDADGNVIHGLESTVVGSLEIDGRITTLRKTYKEKWTKKRGEATQTFTGNETLYFVNDVPLKKSEYQDTIKGIVQEDLFKLITNPLYFSTKLKWTERREILMKILGEIEDSKVIKTNKKLTELNKLLNNTDIDTFKASVSAKRKRLNNEIKTIPVRIDECNKSKKDLDFKALEVQKEKTDKEIEKLKAAISSGAAAEKNIVELKKELYILEDSANTIEREEAKKAEVPARILVKEKEELENELATLDRKRERLLWDMPSDEDIKIHTNKIENLRVRYKNIVKKPFTLDADKTICPTCKREFDNIEQLREEFESNFNKDKASKLEEINQEGKETKKILNDFKNHRQKLSIDIGKMSTTIEEYKVKIIEKKREIADFKPTTNLASNKVYAKIKHRMGEIQNELTQDKTDNDNNNLKIKISNLEFELDNVNSQLSYKKHNADMELRTKELMNQERELGEQIAELEKHEFLCEEFVKTKVSLLENSINEKFKNVTFKLFDMQVNGALNECCEALVEGVPFTSANNASKYNAGLDIINTLCDYYQVTAPIFIDNREGINNIIPVNSQIINLRVTASGKLKIESEEL